MATDGQGESPVGERVAANLAALRERRGLTVRGLSERLSEIGRPILPSGISKAEQGRRRVDVDDLVALAVLLNVAPNRFLLTATADDSPIKLASEVTTSAWNAWAWACGDARLGEYTAAGPVDLFRYRFSRENRPHNPIRIVPWSEVAQHWDVLEPLARAVRKAADAGLSIDAVVSFAEHAVQHDVTEMLDGAEGGDDGEHREAP